MLIVRNTFTAKPGQASKLAALFKDMATSASIPNHRVLTDVTGDFNHVVFEHQVESLAALDALMETFANNQVIRQKMAGYTDLWETGRREILKIM